METCRICSIKAEIRINVFDIYRNKYNLQEIIYELSQIELHSGDHLPICICEVCSNKLVDCHLFRQKLLESKTNLEQDNLADFGNKTGESVFAVTPNEVKVFVNELPVVPESDDRWDNDAADDDDDSESNGNIDISSFLDCDQTELQYDCDVCGEFFENRTVLVTHLRSKHSEIYESKVYVNQKLASELACQWCLRQYSNSSNYHQHIKEAHDFKGKFNIKMYRSDSTVKPAPDSYVSSECNENDSLRWTNNVEVDEHRKKYKCTACLQEFKYNSNYRRHLKSYHGLVGKIKTQAFQQLLEGPLRKYICDACDQPFCKPKLFIQHFHQNHMTISTEDLNQRYAKRCKCQWCWKQFSSSSNFYRHLKHAHGITDRFRVRRKEYPRSDKRYVCEKCHKVYINPEAFINHFKRAHFEEKDNDDCLFCQICAKFYSTRSNYRKHIRTFHMQDYENCSTAQNLKLTCENCKCNFGNREEFVQHLFQEHGIGDALDGNQENVPAKELVCPICAKRSTTRSNFRRHLRHVHDLDEEINLILKPVNGETRKYICEKCDGEFSRRQEFVRHFYQQHLTIDKDALSNLSDENLACPGCLKEFSSHKRLSRHLNIYHGLNIKKGKADDADVRQQTSTRKSKKEKGLKCAICAKAYSSMSNLRRHLYDMHCMFDEMADVNSSAGNVMDDGIVEASERTDIKCQVCNKKMSNTSNLYRHLRGIHGLSQSFFMFTEAQKTGGLLDELCLEQSAETPRKFHCEKCDKTFDDSKKYLNHFQYKHMRIGEESFKKCPYCVKTFIFTKTGAYATLQRHIRKYHKKESEQSSQETPPNDIVQCPECDRQFIEIFDMYRHFKVHDKDNRDNDDGYNFECEPCKIELNTFNEYFDHKRTVHNIIDKELIKAIKCNWCGERFRKFGGFQLHLRTTHHQNKLQHSAEDGQRYRDSNSKSRLCPLCGKLFSSSTSLTGHLATHREEEIFQCTMCPKKFRTNNSLHSHLTVHKAERKYQCHICSKGFKTRAHLKRHFFVHGIGVVFHECRICGKKFNRDSNLRIHMWVHREGYPFNCSFCGKGFARKNKMNAHIESEHSVIDPNKPTSSQT